LRRKIIIQYLRLKISSAKKYTPDEPLIGDQYEKASFNKIHYGARYSLRGAAVDLLALQEPFHRCTFFSETHS